MQISSECSWITSPLRGLKFKAYSEFIRKGRLNYAYYNWSNQIREPFLFSPLRKESRFSFEASYEILHDLFAETYYGYSDITDEDPERTPEFLLVKNILSVFHSTTGCRRCDFSPLGNKIVALTIGSNIYDSEIYLMDANGNNMTLLFDNLPGVIESPSFSTDGNRIVFTRDISGHEVSSGRQLDSHIFIMNIDGSDTLDVSTNKPVGTNDLHPRFSPDGSRIIFTNAVNDGSSTKEIWIMDVNGNNREKLLSNGEMPDWR